MTRANNGKLIDFIDKVLDDTHFSLNIYDKKFYLSSLLHIALLGQEAQYENPIMYFEQVGTLALEDDDFFTKYCETIEGLTIESLNEFLRFVTAYNYKFLPPEQNLVKEFARLILQDNSTEKWVDDFITYGWYDNKKQINIINLYALGELIYEIKNAHSEMKNKNTVFVHDTIQEFEETFAKELRGFEFVFDDSKKNPLIQIADNTVGIVNKIFVLMIQAFREKREWEAESEWLMKLAAKVFKKIGAHNIKFTVPICDWAVAYCVIEMFSSRFPKRMRNNFIFNDLYMKRQAMFCDEIEYRASKGIDAVTKRLKE